MPINNSNSNTSLNPLQFTHLGFQLRRLRILMPHNSNNPNHSIRIILNNNKGLTMARLLLSQCRPMCPTRLRNA
ncbi:hypothetical protein K7X08_009849 [Anisodus acutangulus]|uniref:Uncharacterized protein n=1 Tax=Anisodus acutangulus TaxID=402998 RepID=A0A9Q1RV64_9SOLA|nr:hypothetical protein K7X08_009849 [Anisodus acutangulus]